MKLTIAEKQYYVDFFHIIGPDFRRLYDLEEDIAMSTKQLIYNTTGVYPSDSSQVIISNGTTTCHIYDNLEAYKEHKAVVAEGEAYCSPDDNFSRKLGRKISFSRALEALQLTREERFKWWQEYGKLMPKDLR